MRYLVKVAHFIAVELDETKFTDAFLEEFRKDFYPFDGKEDHAHHIAQLHVRDLLEPAFTEGYGPLSAMGIKAQVVNVVIETEHQS